MITHPKNCMIPFPRDLPPPRLNTDILEKKKRIKILDLKHIDQHKGVIFLNNEENLILNLSILKLSNFIFS